MTYITRTDCEARLQIHYKGQYIKMDVNIFRKDYHNHELTRFVHLFRAHFIVIRTCYIMWYMVAQKGVYAGVSFIKKGPYNYVDNARYQN